MIIDPTHRIEYSSGMMMKASALAHPNIAFIKYWGLKDKTLRIPSNGSISMNIGCLTARTTVNFDPQLKQDSLTLNGQPITGQGLLRIQKFMNRIRQLGKQDLFAEIHSETNFPVGAGVASSAAGFAALALAGTSALGLNLSERELSSLARFGSGSACRSIPGGFVEWKTDVQDDETYAVSIAPADHWNLVDCIAILSEGHKPVGSEAGMALADTSPFQQTRVLDSTRRLDLCRVAIRDKDFDALAQVTELDSNMMHSVMMTANPPLFYWYPQSLGIMKAVKSWQKEGLPVTYTLDAGPNVHVICTQAVMGEVLSRLHQLHGVIDVLKGIPAGPARLVPEDAQT